MDKPLITMIAPLALPLSAYQVDAGEGPSGELYTSREVIPVVGMALMDGEVEYLIHDQEYASPLVLPDYEAMRGPYVSLVGVRPEGQSPSEDEWREAEETVRLTVQMHKRRTEAAKAGTA